MVRRTSRSPDQTQNVLEVILFLAASAVVTASAIVAKEARGAPALLALESDREQDSSEHLVVMVDEADERPSPLPTVSDLSLRWFDGRPVRPTRTLWMKVTGYSPDPRSCGKFADGQTATLHSVWTNGMRLVAADPEVLAYGSILSVPGYAESTLVPVLDCGGAIKGMRLDVLFPTHEEAMQWGVRELPVTLYEYADGLPAPDPRRVR